MEVKIVKYDNGDKITTCYVGFDDHGDYEHAKKHAEEWGWKLREVPSKNFCEDPSRFF